ncbi:MAG: glycosyl hydrolase [Pirellulaceae bacterium]
MNNPIPRRPVDQRTVAWVGAASLLTLGAIGSMLCHRNVTPDAMPATSQNVSTPVAYAPLLQAPSLPPIYSYRAQDIDTLRKGFAAPPREAGPWVYWIFFENVMSREEITRELEELAAAGFAGAEMRFLSLYGFSGLPGPWFDPAGWDRLGQQRLEFLSPAFVDMLEHTCAEARRVGLRLAINMGMGWPPGGPWITEAQRSQHLTARAIVVQGPATLGGDKSIPVAQDAKVCAWQIRDDQPDRQEVSVESFRDLGGFVNSSGRLEWDAPDGRWLIGVYESVPGGLCDKGNGPEADPGSREAVLFHLAHIFERLQPQLLERYFGSTLVEVTSDSWEYERRGGARYWSPSMWAMFPTVAGYELPPRLYALLGYGPDCAQTLADVERVERETVRRNFFETATDYLHARGLRHRAQVRGRGLSRDFFEAFSKLDTPEIEEEVFLPEAVWVAHTAGKPIVNAEAFTFLSGHGRNLERDGQQRLHEGPLADPLRVWETNPTMLRWHAGAHFARGINRLQMHSFGYSPPGIPPPGWRIYAEVHLNRNVPWWPYMPQLNRWIARNQWVLQSGAPVADALVYPVRSNAPEGPYNMATDQPVAALNAIDGASRESLALLQQRGGETAYACERLVLLDDVTTLDEVRRIQALLADGTVLVCCRTLPEQWSALQPVADGEAEEDVRQLRARLREALDRGKILDARSRGWQGALADAQTVRWIPAAAQLSFQHRRVQGGEIYYMTNWGEAFAGDVSFPHPELVPEIWDADTGTMLPAGQYRMEQGRTALSLSLGQHESTLVVFTSAEPRLYALRCSGGRVAYESNGSLAARFDGNGPCHVELSDGRTQELRGELPAPCLLDGEWTLTAVPSQGVGLTALAIEKTNLTKLVSWRDIAELRTFAGIASYETRFDVRAALLRDDLALGLELGEVYELADVWLNGRKVATSWFAPHCLDVTSHLRPGQNTLRVDVPNVLKNHLEAGDYARPSGLLGPVRIRPVGRVILEDQAR